MHRLIIILFIPMFLLCKNGYNSKEDSDAILLNLGLLLQRSNRLAISGTAVKGIAKFARVVVNPLKADGTCDGTSVLASELSDENGDYSLVFYKTGSAVCVTVSSNGLTKMYDEKTGSDLGIPASSSFNLVTILPESKIINNSRKNAIVSPFSKFVAKRLQYLVRQAGAGADIGKLHRKASKEVVIRFGLNVGFSSVSGRSNIELNTTRSGISDAGYPELDDISLDLKNTSSPLTAKYVSILAGFSYLSNQYKQGSSLSVNDLESVIDGFASDFEDGAFDGKTIVIGKGTNQLTLPANPLTATLLPSVVNYFKEGGVLSAGVPGTSVGIITAGQVTSQTQFTDNAAIIFNDPGVLSLNYPNSPINFSQGLPIIAVTPVSTGTILGCTSSPVLPTGLTLSANCVISGIPQTEMSATNYTITAIGDSGNTTATLTLSISAIYAWGSFTDNNGTVSFVGNAGTFGEIAIRRKT